MLLDADTVPDSQIKAIVGQAVAEEGFRDGRPASRQTNTMSVGPSTPLATRAGPSAY